MSPLSDSQVKEVLSKIAYPGKSENLVTANIIEHLRIRENSILIILKYDEPDVQIRSKIHESIKTTLEKEFTGYEVNIKQVNTGGGAAPAQQPADPWAGRAPIPNVKNILAVASGKGGVGKSTVSTNLAIALAGQNLKVGLMDSDIYGPSIHIMMGIRDKPIVSPENKLLPSEKFGIKLMSMGFLVESDTPLIWRGPIVQKAVTQFLQDVDWGELDILLVDLPPGTGDVQLTLVQKTPLSGAVVVTTPQEVALVDARRAFHMFKKVETPVLGIIENMSYFTCANCGENHSIFGEGGGSQAAANLGVPFLGEIPIVPQITVSGDEGIPIVAKEPDNEASLAFKQIALQILNSSAIVK